MWQQHSDEPNLECSKIVKLLLKKSSRKKSQWDTKDIRFHLGQHDCAQNFKTFGVKLWTCFPSMKNVFNQSCLWFYFSSLLQHLPTLYPPCHTWLVHRTEDENALHHWVIPRHWFLFQHHWNRGKQLGSVHWYQVSILCVKTTPTQKHSLWLCLWDMWHCYFSNI